MFSANDTTKTTTEENTSILFSIFSTDLLINLVYAVFSLIITILLSKFITNKFVKILEKWSWAWRDELISVLSRTINIIVLSLWFAISLSILWVDMWIFLWWLWFWIGFTLKIFLTNFIAWILMVTQWFYHIWDIVEVWVNWKIWSIKKIHALFTEIEQFDWIIYYVPNVKFLEDEVSNYNSNNIRRIEVKVWVDYETDIVRAKKVMLQVVNTFPNVLKSPESDVLVKSFWTSSIDLVLRFWVDSKDWFIVSQSNVTETVNLAFKQAWIKIPFPQVTLSNRDGFQIKKETNKDII